jgi:hypothetical protein
MASRGRGDPDGSERTSRGVCLQRDVGVTAGKHSQRHRVRQRVSNLRIVTKL